MSWSEKLQIYIEPSLRNLDKQFYGRCEQLVAKYHFLHRSKVDQLTQGPLPITFIFSSADTLNDYFDVEKDLLIQYQTPSLELFPLEEENSYKVETLEEFEDVWDFSINTLMLSVQNLEKDYEKASYPFIREIFSKMSILEREDKILSFDSSRFENIIFEQKKTNEVVSATNTYLREELSLDAGLLNISELINLTKEYFYLPIRVSEKHCLFLYWRGEASSLLKISTILMIYFKSYSRLFETEMISNNWDEIIHSIEIPIVLLDEDGDVLIYNKAFSKIEYSAKQCSKLKNNEQVMIQSNIFRVVYTQNIQCEKLYLFFPVKDFLAISKHSTSEELGIVSSSIAHELNNPLAGILAALDVLRLDEVEKDFAQKLDEMKDGALRCKELVETFLGFSSLNTKESFQEGGLFKFQNLVNQALDLIRFRLIENNIKLNLDYKMLEPFLFPLNPHVVPMIFYLIFGESITHFFHYDLVRRESRLQLDISIKEKSHSVEVFFAPGGEVNGDFFKSRLIEHLNESAHLEIEHNKSSITFRPRANG